MGKVREKFKNHLNCSDDELKGSIAPEYFHLYNKLCTFRK